MIPHGRSSQDPAGAEDCQTRRWAVDPEVGWLIVDACRAQFTTTNSAPFVPLVTLSHRHAKRPSRLLFIHSNVPWEGADQLLCCCTAAVYRAGVTSSNRRNGKDPVRLRSTVHQESFPWENRSQMHTAGGHEEPEVLPPTARQHSMECFLIVSRLLILVSNTHTPETMDCK